jgi:hypothetical protein
MQVAQQFLAALARDWDDRFDALTRNLDCRAGPASSGQTARDTRDLRAQKGRR